MKRTRAPLGKIFKFQNGRGFKKSEWESTGLPIIRITNLNNRDAAFNYYSGPYDKAIEINTGDLLFSWSGTVGSSFGAHLWEGETGLLNQHIFKVDHKENIDRRYAFHALQWVTDQVEKQVNGAVGLVHITKAKLNEFEIPLPSVAEQQYIVSFLDDAFERINAAIANSEKNIANAWELFQSNLQHLFLELSAAECPIKRIGQIAEVSSGGTPLVSTKEFWGGGIPWYSSGELNGIYTKDPERTITSCGLDNSNAKLFPKGSLLIGMYDTAALKMSILDRDAAFNQAVSGVKPNDCLDMKFALYAITVNKPALLRERRGVRQKNLSLKKIKDILIPLPAMSVQKAITQQQDVLAKKVIQIDSMNRAKYTLLAELKQSLLQKAFSGELNNDFTPDSLEL